MTERAGRGSLASSVVTSKTAKGDGQPLIPMNLFAAWDVDRTPPNCVPRLCSLTLSRLTVLKPLGSDISTITLAVKMQSSKRTLRSNEIMLPAGGGLLDTALELRFALQYPHYLKQWEAGNRLQVMLQRRKRYKNRTILGYKTLCSNTINMVAAVQRQMDMELELYGEATSTSGKESVAPLARLQVQSLTSQPVDHEEAAERLKTLSLGDGAVQSTAATLLGGSPAVSLSSSATKSSTNPHSTLSLSHPLVLERGGVGGMRSGFVRYEDEDDDEFSSNDDGGSDSDQTAGLGGVRAGGGAGVGGVSGVVGSGVDRRPARMNKAMMQNRGKILPSNARQRNLKQKFVALLKRFKITEDLQGLENEADEDPTKLTGADLEMDAGDIEDLIDELEDLSDSGPEMDTLSVTSTPKPSLRPFFASSRSLLAPDLSSNPSAFAFPTTGTFFNDKATAPATLNTSSAGGRRLERHYSDESSKRADSDSTHAESMFTDQDRESDTPTASSAHCPSHFSTAAHDDKTKNEKEVRRSRLFNRERSGPSLSSVSSGSVAPSPCSGTSTNAHQQQQTHQQKESCSGSKKSSGAQGNSGSLTSSTSSSKDKSNESSPRKILLEQLVRCMPADDALPDHVVMVSGADLQGCNLAGRLAERQQRAVCTGGVADVRATIACLVSKIQKFCNCSAKPPPAVKVVLMGPDSYVNSVLRCYVEQFSSKPPDWKNYLKFYIVPLVTNSGSSAGTNNNSGNGIGTGGSNNTLSRYLASLDRYYNVNFVSDSWREALDRPAEKMLAASINGGGVDTMGGSSAPAVTTPSKIDVQEVIHRLGRYLTSNGCTVQVPIAEAMITYREPNSEEESTQVFIPFVSEVRIGFAESAAAVMAAAAAMTPGSVDAEDGQQLSNTGASSGPLSGSPPHQSSVMLTVNAAIQPGSSMEREQRDKERTGGRTTPPSSPNISSVHGQRETSTPGAESVELQVDYWLSGASAAAAAAAASATARESIASAAAISLATMAQAVKREKPGPAEQSSVKYTVKAGFRWIVVQRLPHSNVSSSTTASSSGSDASSLFTMTFGLKEKKQKIMRLGKKKEKEKESESKSQVVEGINRLVCQAKTHHSLLKVVIDGVEWNNVKFFQLSSQWQTHIRHFPVALFTESIL
ncbi:phosphofurin acidic cluster sorting protein 2-like isoform X4 [Daphnia pulex]|uniref:phosphofurin acidic cluster sorting protein 2-like isoform X4 n=1 Tax=Daphnia pulex TaxID=6669 RepID=UPI001EDEA68F|nr:phosphofurin acidic cluster sorting protein 2-like isoform X4 [Daphnia pulex]